MAFAALALAAAAAPAGAASLPAGATAILSGAPDLLSLAQGDDGTSPSFGGSLSADGRYAAFVSLSPAFGVLPGRAAVFVRDLASGELKVVSREEGEDGPLLGMSSTGARQLVLMNGAVPQISADGCCVAFVVPNSLDGSTHVYLRDVQHGHTTIADRADGTDTLGAGLVGDVSISDDGSRVAFLTQDRLVGDDTDMAQDAYVRDLKAHRTFLVDRASGETGAKGSFGASAHVAIGGDGRRVAFTTSDRLAADDADTANDAYVRTIDAPFATTLAGVTGDATTDRSIARALALDRDGGRLLFQAQPGLNPVLYVRDLGAGTTEVASRADGPAGTPILAGNANPPFAGSAALSADGGHVAFVAPSQPGIAPGDPGDGALEVYARDLGRGETRLVSRRSGPTGPPAGFNVVSSPLAVTADGGCVLFRGTASLLTPPASATNAQALLRAVAPDCGRVATTPPGGGDPGPGGPGPGGPGPSGAAALSGLSLKPARFFVGGRKGGSRIAFRLDKGGASVALAFDRLLAGHRKGKRCLTAARRGKRCTVVRRAGRLTVTRTNAGPNAVSFSGKLGRKALAPGSYRLTATPLHGTSRTVRFVVVKAPKPKRKARR